MRILLSNDDGIDAPGLMALQEELAKRAEVWVVAPDREQSASSHSITLHRPLRVTPRGERRFAIDGTPTDCVYIAVHHLMRGKRPDVVCSGINHGPNLGVDVLYSGTVAAATEGALLGISSIAFSLAGGEAFQGPARFAAALAEEVAARPLPQSTLLNVNFPAVETERFAVTRLGKRNYGAMVEERRDPRGRSYYWLGGNSSGYERLPGSDCDALLSEGLISVTPLNLDFTDHAVLHALRGWEVAGYTQERAA